MVDRASKRIFDRRGGGISVICRQRSCSRLTDKSRQKRTIMPDKGGSVRGERECATGKARGHHRGISEGGGRTWARARWYKIALSIAPGRKVHVEIWTTESI